MATFPFSFKRVWVATVFLTILSVPSAHAETLQKSDASPPELLQNIRALEANQLLLTRYETDCHNLKRALRENLANESTRRLTETKLANLEHIKKIISEEYFKLIETLPEETKADKLMNYLLIKENVKNQAVLSLELRKYEAESYYELHDKAHAFMRASQYEEALSAYQKISHLWPNDEEAFLMMGHIHLGLVQFEQSENAFYNAIQINPANRTKIADFYIQKTRHEPDSDQALTDLGYIYFMEENYQKASETFKKALSLNPQNPLAQNGLQISLNSLIL